MLRSLRWLGFVGLIVLFGIVIIGLLGSTVIAQHPNLQPGHGWNSRGMMGSWSISPLITDTVPYGYRYDGQQPSMVGYRGCGSRTGGMMRSPMAWHRSRGWVAPGGYDQQAGVQDEYAPATPSDDDSLTKTVVDVSYQSDVQPIFDARCVACHGNAVGLSLNSYDDVLRGSMNGPVVVPSSPASSRLIHNVSIGFMPLGGPALTQGQVQTLSDWVAAGARNN